MSGLTRLTHLLTRLLRQLGNRLGNTTIARRESRGKYSPRHPQPAQRDSLRSHMSRQAMELAHFLGGLLESPIRRNCVVVPEGLRLRARHAYLVQTGLCLTSTRKIQR